MESALTYITNAVLLDDKNAEYQFYLGRIQSRLSNSDKAIEAYETAIKLKLAKKEYLYFLALEYWSAGKVSKCITYINKTISIDSNYHEALVLQLRTLINRSLFKDAEKLSVKIQSLKSPGLEFVLLNIQLLYYLSRFEEAIKEYKKIKQFRFSSNDQKETAFCIARCYSRLKLYQDAILIYEQLPDESRVDYYKGCALLNQDNAEDALKLFTKVISLESSGREK